MPQPSLSDLTAFLAIADHGSFRAAARSLGVSPSALSHALRGLERRLDLRLVNRTTRSVALTEAGARLANRLRPALAGIDDALEATRDEAARLAGRIRISAPAFGACRLAETVAGPFQAAHPGVSFEISVDTALVDLVRDGYDAGVRLREQVPPDMVAVPITPATSFVAAASPGYLARCRTPAVPSDLDRHECLRQRLATGSVYRWEFLTRGRPVAIEPRGGFASNDQAVLVAAALGGAGICFVAAHLVEPHLAAGRLVRLLAEHTPGFDGLCLYYPPSRHPTRAFSAFVDAVRAALPKPKPA